MALNEEQQTEAVFKSVRTDVDPVSGNDVPPGSLPEEVRDDIPAMLSEGEYVVPADVLRFYGMKFFEDLRAEAKMGLAKMEENGRIGGEPVPMGGPSQGGNDLTAEEMAVLQELGMAVGGMVPQATQSNMGYGQSSPVAMGNVGYQAGGLEDGSNAVDAGITQQSLMSNFAPGFLAQAGMQQQPVQTEVEEVRPITMYGPNGEVEVVILPMAQARYEELLNMGYTEEQTSVTTQTSVGVEDETDRGPDETGTDTTGPSISEMNAEELGEAAKGLQAMNALATAVTAFSPVVGLGIKGIAKSQQNAINNRAEELNIPSLTSDDTTSKGLLSSIVSDVTAFFTGKTDDTEETPTPTTTPTTTSTAPQTQTEAEVDIEAFGGKGDDVTPTPQGPTAEQSAQAEAEAEVSIDAFGGDVAPVGDPDPTPQGVMV